MFNYDHSPFIDLLIDGLESKWVPDIEEDDKHYPWISFPVARFLDGLWELYRNHPNSRFLDVGGGIGTKSVLAKLAGFDVTYLELRPEYIEVARNIFKKFEVDIPILQGDALEYQGYVGYDCIYAYTPFSDWELEKALNFHIAKTCQPSALLFLPGDNYLTELGWHKTIHEVWSY